MIKGIFISEWDNGLIQTPAELNELTGEVTTESVDVDGMEHLIGEFFDDNNGHVKDICPICHEYILKTEMVEGVGKQLHEVQKCTNPNCSEF